MHNQRQSNKMRQINNRHALPALVLEMPVRVMSLSFPRICSNLQFFNFFKKIQCLSVHYSQQTNS